MIKYANLIEISPRKLDRIESFLLLAQFVFAVFSRTKIGVFSLTFESFEANK